MIIVALSRVLTAVDFDNQTTLDANEIRDKSTDQNLAAKLELMKSAIGKL